jgi:NifB/MoaA-like Fe-S oxidoreductase
VNKGGNTAWSSFRFVIIDGAFFISKFILKGENNMGIYEELQARGVIAQVKDEPLIKELVDRTVSKWHNLDCKVYAIKNEFFGGHINVAGLVTGTDIINQLSGKDLGSELIVPDVMLRHENDMFLDSVTLEELSEKLGTKVRVIRTDGASLIDALININKRK